MNEFEKLAIGVTFVVICFSFIFLVARIKTAEHTFCDEAATSDFSSTDCNSFPFSLFFYPVREFYPVFMDSNRCLKSIRRLDVSPHFLYYVKSQSAQTKIKYENKIQRIPMPIHNKIGTKLEVFIQLDWPLLSD